MKQSYIEFMAEYNRQRIIEEMEQIRLEKLALRSRVNRPGLFGRTMFNFANWMISTGGQIRQRYEIPAMPCSKPPTENFAR